MNDPLDPLLSTLRDETDPRADRAAFGLETRVLARLRDERLDAARWFRRWSLAFGGCTAVCAGLFTHSLFDLSSSGLDAALGGHWLLLGWF